jgi:hypothetical protein
MPLDAQMLKSICEDGRKDTKGWGPIKYTTFENEMTPFEVIKPMMKVHRIFFSLKSTLCSIQFLIIIISSIFLSLLSLHVFLHRATMLRMIEREPTQKTFLSNDLNAGSSVTWIALS